MPELTKINVAKGLAVTAVVATVVVAGNYLYKRYVAVKKN